MLASAPSASASVLDNGPLASPRETKTGSGADDEVAVTPRMIAVQYQLSGSVGVPGSWLEVEEITECNTSGKRLAERATTSISWHW